MKHSALSVLFLALLRPGLVGALITTLVLEDPSQPVCSGETVTYMCTVGGDIITWHIPGGEFSQIYGRHTEGDEGEFHWEILQRPAGSNIVRSTLSFSAVGGDTIGCRNASEEFVYLQVQVEGPPSAPDQPLTSINNIHQINSTFSTAKLVWTRPEDNSGHISRYVMTVDPPTPLPANGIVESTDSLFEDREITVTLRHGQRYSFQVRADNCYNMQPGELSSPLTIHLQVPPSSSNCTTTVVYDYFSNYLNSIETVWRTVSDPPEPIAPGITADIQSYQISLIPTSEAPSINITTSDLTLCQDNCVLVVPSTGITSLYYSVFVAAENILGPGERRSCNSQKIGARNDLVGVEVQQCEGGVKVSCRLLLGFVGASNCEITYGTDPTRAYLPYVDTSEEVGVGEDVITVKLSNPLQTNATYYYNLTLIHVNTAVRVLGTFKTAGFCQASDLGTQVEEILSQCRPSEGAASIRNGVVCYTGTATGSLAYYICDDGYEVNVLLEGAMNPRECNLGGQWSGTQLECTPKEESDTASLSDDPQPPNNCGLGIGIAVALCCLVIAPLSAAVGAVSACLVVRKRIRRKGRPLPEPPQLTEEMPDTYNLVYDYVSNEKIGTARNEAYGQHNATFQKIEEEEKLENEEKLESEDKLDNREKLEAEEYVKPTTLL